jgi:CBS domain-containing protein
MTAAPETLPVDAKVAFALQRMDVGGYRHLPIVDDAGTVTGIISVRDILKYLAAKLAA